jgi:mannosyltransferase OCH1-like enzyme
VLTKLRRQGSLDLSLPATAMPAIPRVIHQFWDSGIAPPDVATLMRSWPSQNPGWDYRRYDQTEALAYLRSSFPPEVAQAFRQARQPAQQADLFRLAVLLAEGGAYADADDRCVAPLDTPLADADLLLWQEPLGSVGNSFMAAVPGHPVIEAALVQAVEATLRGDAETLWLSTGPGLLSRALVQYLTGEGLVQASGQRIVVLERWDLREFCMPCCKAAYKAGAQHWFNQEAAAPSG